MPLCVSILEQVPQDLVAIDGFDGLISAVVETVNVSPEECTHDGYATGTNARSKVAEIAAFSLYFTGTDAYVGA